MYTHDIYSTYLYIYIIYTLIYTIHIWYANIHTCESIHRNINIRLWYLWCKFHFQTCIPGSLNRIVPCLLPCHLALKIIFSRWPDVDTREIFHRKWKFFNAKWSWHVLINGQKSPIHHERRFFCQDTPHVIAETQKRNPECNMAYLCVSCVTWTYWKKNSPGFFGSYGSLCCPWPFSASEAKFDQIRTSNGLNHPRRVWGPMLFIWCIIRIWMKNHLTNRSSKFCFFIHMTMTQGKTDPTKNKWQPQKAQQKERREWSKGGPCSHKLSTGRQAPHFFIAWQKLISLQNDMNMFLAFFSF